MFNSSPQNTLEEDDKPTVIMTTIDDNQGSLYNHLEKIEEHLIELLATKDKYKIKQMKVGKWKRNEISHLCDKLGCDV